LKRILGENCKIEHGLKAVKIREIMIYQLGEEDARFKQGCQGWRVNEQAPGRVTMLWVINVDS